MAQSAEGSRLRGGLQEFECRRPLVIVQPLVIRESIPLGSRRDRPSPIGRGIRIRRHGDVQRGRGELEGGRGRPIEDGGRLPVCPEQRLDASPQLRIRRAFPIEDGIPPGGIRGPDRRPEDGLDTSRINGHGILLGKELTLACVARDRGRRSHCGCGRGHPKARPGRRSIPAPPPDRRPSGKPGIIVIPLYGWDLRSRSAGRHPSQHTTDRADPKCTVARPAKDTRVRVRRANVRARRRRPAALGGRPRPRMNHNIDPFSAPYNLPAGSSPGSAGNRRSNSLPRSI